MSWRAPRAAGTTLLLLVVAAASGCRSTEVDELRSTVEELKIENARMNASLAHLQFPRVALAWPGYGWSVAPDWDVELAVEHALAEQDLPPGAALPVEAEHGRGVSLTSSALFEPGSGELTQRGARFVAALANHAPEPRQAAFVELEVDGAEPVQAQGGVGEDTLSLQRSLALLEALRAHDLAGPETGLRLRAAEDGEPRIRVLWTDGEGPSWIWENTAAIEAGGDPWVAMRYTVPEDPSDVLPYYPPGASSLSSRREAAGSLAESVLLHDERGKLRVRIDLDDGAPRMGFLDDEGRTRIELGLDAEGEPYLRFLDQDGEPTEPLP